MVKINMIEKISYYLANKIYMCSEADVTCAVDEKNEDVQVLQYGIECMINMSISFIILGKKVIREIILPGLFLSKKNRFSVTFGWKSE